MSKHVYIFKNLIIILYINIIWADCFPDEEVVSPVVGRHVLLLLGKVEEGLRGPDNHNYCTYYGHSSVITYTPGWKKMFS